MQEGRSRKRDNIKKQTNIAPGIMESCVCKFTQMVQFSFYWQTCSQILKTFQIFTLKLTTQTGVWMSQPPTPPPPPASRLWCTVECGLVCVSCPNLSESEKVATVLGPHPTVQARTETDADFVSRSCCCLGYGLFTPVTRVVFRGCRVNHKPLAVN